MKAAVIGVLRMLAALLLVGVALAVLFTPSKARSRSVYR